MEKTFSNGEVIFESGGDSREMYVVQEGKVEIYDRYDGHEIILAVRSRGDFFGELALLESLPRTASARAVGETKTLVIRQGYFLKMIRSDPAFCFELMQSLSSRFRYINDKLRAVLETGKGDQKQIQEIITWSEYPAESDKGSGES